MRFTKKMKKALSVVMTGALVIAGVNFGMTKTKADDKYVDSSFKVCNQAITDFAGDGTYTHAFEKGAWTTWEETGIYNFGAFEADREFALSNVSLTVNGTYIFPIAQEKIKHYPNNNDAGEMQSYKADIPNAWADGYAKDEAMFTTEDNAASLVFSYDKSKEGEFDTIKLMVGDAKTNISSVSITFTYQLTGSTEKDPEIVLPTSGIYLDWAGTWKKQGSDNATTSTSKAENAKVAITLGEWGISISNLKLDCMTNPMIEVSYTANDDKLQIADSDWTKLTYSQGDSSTTCDLSSYAKDSLNIGSESNKMVITGISIYNNTVDCAKVKIADNITKAEALTQADYTADSWAKLTEALGAAKGLADTATLAQINAANKALKDAIAGLKTPTTGGDATPTPTPGGDATPTPAPGGDATPTPAPGGNATPTPAPGGDATPTPAPGGDATPTPAPGGDATPTPAPGGDATPTPAPGGNATPTPAPGGNATPTPAPGGDNTPTTVGLAKNAKATVGNFSYKVTKTSVKNAGKTTNGNVTVVAMSKKGKKAKKLSVPATIKAKGATYTVTAIGANAMKGSKATSVTLGKNVKSIAKNAFANCKKLSKLSIKAKLSSVSKGAFKGCKKKIKVSGTSKKQNLKKLKKSGYKKFK